MDRKDAAAERELQAALVDAPDAPALHFLLGRLYQKEGKGKARQTFGASE